MDLATLTAILRRFGTGLSQHARLITLTSAHDVTLPDAPLAERVRGREAVNETYRFDVDALSTSTDLDLSGFIGEELTTTLLQPDGTRRAWHGICTAAEWLGADGGVARYRLRLEPALALLRLRRDSYIFQNKNVEGIVSELFADYPQLRFEFDVTQDMPARAICTQYRESDYDFFVRLMASEGLSWRFEHDQGDVADDGQARHRLVIVDGAAAFPDTPGNPVIRFHGMRATDSDDAIDAFRARRRVQANAVSISSWAPGQLVAPAAEQEPYLDAGEVPVAQVHDGAGERIATDSGAAERLSRLMLQALELDNKLFEGEGAVRRLAAGHAFALTQHDRYPLGENAFKVLWVEHEARNNVGARIATADAGDIEPGTYRNRFGCVRSVVPVLPRATALPNPHTALGPQTALVVGLPDSVATTTRDHQVRVQFAWQRGAGGNPGSPYHDTDADGCAPGDDRSGTWVRVAEALAGPNWGSQFTPRVGTEVLVDFIENDIDRPLVVAQLYTGPDAPPFAAGVDSGVDHAGTISGIHTQTFDGAGWNQWQLDDTPGQLRMRLATSMAATQLNLGHLVHQPAGSARRGTYRGSGFELRTDAWGVVRGGDGVLLTTSTRQGLGASVASTQMDAAEAVGSLKAAQSLDKVLRESAKAQNALSSGAAAQAQQDFIAQIDPSAQGKFAGPVNGQAAAKAASGSRELDAATPVERFGKPVVLMDSQAGIDWATPASTVLFAGQQLHWTTGSDMHMSAAHTLSSVSAEATTLYTHEGGIQAIAANGPVSLQAHTDQLEILADKEVTVISVNDGIEVKAAKKIVLQAGQASVTLEGGDITFACPGTFSVKGAQHPFEGGARAGAKSEALPGDLIGAAARSLFTAYGSQNSRLQEARGADSNILDSNAAAQANDGSTWSQDDDGYPHGNQYRYLTGGPAAAGAAGKPANSASTAGVGTASRTAPPLSSQQLQAQADQQYRNVALLTNAAKYANAAGDPKSAADYTKAAVDAANAGAAYAQAAQNAETITASAPTVTQSVNPFADGWNTGENSAGFGQPGGIKPDYAVGGIGSLSASGGLAVNLHDGSTYLGAGAAMGDPRSVSFKPSLTGTFGWILGSRDTAATNSFLGGDGNQAFISIPTPFAVNGFAAITHAYGGSYAIELGVASPGKFAAGVTPWSHSTNVYNGSNN